MPLDPGTTLGPYSVTAKIGEGGMGEVYQARDTKLDRDVALKVLPEAFTADPDRLARFEREAKVLASLNHPNIGTIYGLEETEGVKALVLELVEGPTLADRIKQGPIPLDEAVPIAKQIAEALEAAHEAGVIHRDLKPANIKVREDGTVKVLDFGLAKALDPNPEGDPSQSPTLTAAATQMGVIMGTAAYMSPEQARGKPVDKRTDIWAFGVVLFEMLAGKKVFEGEDVSLTLSAVLQRDPVWGALPKGVSPVLNSYLRRCLERDPRQRIRDVGDVRLALEGAFETVGSTGGALRESPGWRRRLPWVLCGAVVAAWGLVSWYAPDSAPPRGVTRWAVDLPPDATFVHRSRLAIAPDGSRVALGLLRGQESHIYLRDLSSVDATLLPGTAGGRGPFFAPDGERIGFFADGQLRWVPVEGGTPVVLAETSLDPQDGSWSSDGTIIYSPYLSAGLWQVSEDGGAARELTSPDSAAGDLGHWWPQILPGSEAVLFTIYASPLEKARIAVHSLLTGEQRVLVEGAVFARYLASGHLAFVRNETLMAMPFDVASLEPRGAATPVLENTALNAAGGESKYDVAENGTLVYVRASDFTPNRVLAWLNDARESQPLSREDRRYAEPRLSPDATRIAVVVQDLNPDVWVFDLARGTLSRLTFGDSAEQDPVWTPDGEMLVFASERPVFDLYWTAADGSGEEELLFAND